MATQKPISTISYNTEPFLREKLNELVKAHIIQAYQYIYHIGEEGDKDHIHLRVEPNKKLDMMDLTEYLREYVGKEDKPRVVRPWRMSKEADWFLYAVHDEMYLRLKYGGGESKEKMPYQWQDIQVSDGYDLEVAFVRAQQSLKHSNSNLASRLQEGVKSIDLIKEGENPFLVNGIWRALVKDDYSRLLENYEELSQRYNTILNLLHRAGFEIGADDDNNPVLVPIDNSDISHILNKP